MKKIIDTVNNAYHALDTALPCYLRDDHLNQLSFVGGLATPDTGE